MEVGTSKSSQERTFTAKRSLSVMMTLFTRYSQIFLSIIHPLGSTRVGNELWTNWNKALLRLWQTQLNFAVFCASSACGVNSEHLNYAKHSISI